MVVVGGGDDDGVDKAAVHHFRSGGKDFYAFQILAGPLLSFFLNVCYGAKNHAVYLACNDVFCVTGTHVADTDDADSYLIHFRPHSCLVGLIADVSKNLFKRVRSSRKSGLAVGIGILVLDFLPLKVFKAGKYAKVRFDR